MTMVMLFVAFLGGFVAGELDGERRWKRLAFETLDVAAHAIAQLRSTARTGCGRDASY